MTELFTNAHFWVPHGVAVAVAAIAAMIVYDVCMVLGVFTACRENRPSIIITASSLTTAVLSGVFFRETQANWLMSSFPPAYDFILWVFAQSNAGSPASNVFSYVSVYAACTAVFTITAAILSTAFSFYWFGIGGEWSLRGAHISRDRVSVNAKNALRFGKTTVPVDFETRGFSLFGTTGTGKSQAILQILSTARRRGQKAIIVDPGGEMMSRLWQPGDVILNPEDERSVDWSIWADMKFVDEIPTFSESIIEPGTGESQQWNEYARTMLEVFFEYLFRNNLRKTKHVTNLMYLTDEELAEVCGDSTVKRVVTGTNTKGRDSILSIIALALKPWSSLNPESSRDAFSIDDFIRGDHDRWLWMPYSQKTGAAFLPLRRMWIDIALRSIVSGKELKGREVANKRIWFVLDEIHNQGKLEFLPEATAMGRKFGMAHVLGIHSKSQLDEIYGIAGAQTILSTTQNELILRAADPDTAEYSSRRIGDRESQRKEKSQSRGEGGRSENLQYQRQIDRAVLPSEIMNLPDLEGYFLFPAGGQKKVKIEYLANLFPARIEPLIRSQSDNFSRHKYMPLKDIVFKKIMDAEDSETASKLKLKKPASAQPTDA